MWVKQPFGTLFRSDSGVIPVVWPPSSQRGCSYHMPPIYIYSELLLHIRQVAVLAILPSPANKTTHVGLSADSRTLSLEHNGERAVIGLPCPVLGIANRRDDTTQQELSFRMQPSGAARLPIPGKLSFGEAPWSASELTPNVQIACKACKNPLVRPIAVWKDLPSGGWAEMMELWHCHKPHISVNGDDASSTSTKGYNAANRIAPTSGTALVDVSHFIIADEDCIGMQINNIEKLLVCGECKDIVGIEDKSTPGCVCLYKWSLALQSLERRLTKIVSAINRSKESGWKTYSFQQILAAQLLTLIEETAVYKYLICSGEENVTEDALLIWVFTPDLMYSTSVEKGPRRSMKIFYKTISEPSTKLEVSSDPKVEEYQLPSYILRQLSRDLEDSSNILPQSARRHQTWTIGLLER